MKICAIVAAAGAGRRMKADRPKQFLELEGTPILALTLRKLNASPLIDRIIVPSPPEAVGEVRALAGAAGLARPVTAVAGGDRRQDSVAIAIRTVPEEVDLVLVHDGVRPFVSLQEIADVVEGAGRTGAAILAIPITDTVKEAERDVVKSTLRREHLVLAQTPQVFRAGILREAFESAARDGYYGTDESSLVERLGYPVLLVRGSERNLKITRPVDLSLARLLLEEERMPVE